MLEVSGACRWQDEQKARRPARGDPFVWLVLVAYAVWSGAVEEMKASAAGSKEALWAQVMAHEMTAYVPVQCQSCGRRVPDETTPGNTDAEVGLSEAAPTAEEAPLVRGGWYRGPRGPVVFVLDCPACGARSRWFRSAAASAQVAAAVAGAVQHLFDVQVYNWTDVARGAMPQCLFGAVSQNGFRSLP